MKRMIFAAVAIVLSAPAAANTPIVLSDDGVIAHVRYGDLNLQSSGDRSKLKGRIRMAAEMLCLDANNVNPLAVSPTRAECYRGAIASGLDQMNELVSR
jgi:UrcA family protein